MSSILALVYSCCWWHWFSEADLWAQGVFTDVCADLLFFAWISISWRSWW